MTQQKRTQQKRTDAEIIEALEKSGGLITHAAKLLGITRNTIYRRMQSSKKVTEAVDDARAIMVDELITAFRQRVKSGDTTAIIFGLKCLGKSAGFVEKQLTELTINAATTDRAAAMAQALGLNTEASEGASGEVAKDAEPSPN